MTFIALAVIVGKGSSALCPLPGSNYAITIPPGVRLGPNDNIRPFVTSAVATPPPLAPQQQVIVVVPSPVELSDRPAAPQVIQPELANSALTPRLSPVNAAPFDAGRSFGFDVQP